MSLQLAPAGITSDLLQLGVNPPPELLELVEQRRLLFEAVHAKPADDVAAAFERGEVTSKNIVKVASAAATAEGNRERLRAILGALDKPWAQHTARILREHGDAIVTALRPGFDAQIAVLVETVELIGVNPDHRVIGAGGAGLSIAAGRRKEAIQKLRAVRILTNVLRDVGYYREDGPARFLAGPLTAADLDRAREAVAQGGDLFEQLIGAGLRVRLNTAAEMAEIVDAARSAEEKRRQAAEDARQAEGERRAAVIADRYRRSAPAA